MSSKEGAESEKTAPAKPRRQARKFEANLLLDKDRGLEKLLRMFGKFDQSAPLEGREGLAIMMRYYQQWLYQLYPADFGDMCEKIGGYNGVRNICREFVDDRNGSGRYIQNIEDGEETGNTENNSNQSFLDDDDDLEVVNEEEGGSVENKQVTPTNQNVEPQEDPEVDAEILDLIGDQF